LNWQDEKRTFLIEIVFLKDPDLKKTHKQLRLDVLEMTGQN
jgi:hypothetical protein